MFLDEFGCVCDEKMKKGTWPAKDCLGKEKSLSSEDWTERWRDERMTNVSDRWVLVRLYRIK
jgi:hypothetical protein